MEAAAPLAGLLEVTTADPDDVLEAFVRYTESQGLSLYPAQEDAILELLAGRHVVLDTPTGSGKSLVALALHFKALVEERVSWYTSPIKALVNEKFFALCEALGPERVGLMTGDATINPDAKVVCCTAEILANAALRGDRQVDYVVMDEFHYYADRDRGVAWQIPLLTLKDTVFLLMSATLGNVAPITEPLEAFTGRKASRVQSFERPVPLTYEYRDTPLHETIPDLLAQGEAPIYLVSFTQREVADVAQSLTSVDLCTRDEKNALGEALAEERFETPYGKDLHRFLRHGIGLHHAGLLPRYRRLVERLAQQGLLKVISGTDTLGVGINIPLRTVVLQRLYKYDGEKNRLLQVREFRQIAGRAGRKGFDDHGRVVVQAPEHVIENKRLEEKAARRPDLKKKIVKKKPAQGYVGWDKATFERLIEAPPEALEPQFEVTHGMLLEVLRSPAGQASPDGGYRRILDLVERSHQTAGQKRLHKRTSARRLRSLREAGIVERVRGDLGRGSRLQVRQDFQEDYNLNQTLSLYLLDAVGRLDFESESYGLDVLSLVEAILEDPSVVLWKQLDKLKGELIARLKAEGLEYEERMAELEKVELPRPNAEFIYATFEAFSKRHPWVGTDYIRPKSVARELFERMAEFNDYVRDYGLQRSEGLLLRYLSDAYKTLVQGVPEPLKTEQVMDVVAFLRDTLRRVDASLIQEWERMQGLAPSEPAPRAALLSRPVDPAADPRAFAARLRNEAHRLLRAVALRDWEAAVAAVRGEVFPWTPDDLAALCAPFFEEHAAVDLTPRARQPRHTVVKQEGPRTWTLYQNVLPPAEAPDVSLVPGALAAEIAAEARAERGVDPEGGGEEAAWSLLLSVDLETLPEAEDAPLIELVDFRR